MTQSADSVLTRLRPVGLLIDGVEFVPLDIVEAHTPFATPPGADVRVVYVLARNDGEAWSVAAGTVTLMEAMRVVTAAGFTPVKTEANQRLRAWLDLNDDYWPPKDWQPPPNDGSEA